MAGGNKVGAQAIPSAVFKRSNLSSLSVYCPSFMTDLRRTTLAELVVLSSHYSTKPYDELSV